MSDPNPYISAKKSDDKTQLVITVPVAMGESMCAAAHRFRDSCSYPSEGAALDAIYRTLKSVGYKGEL